MTEKSNYEMMVSGEPYDPVDEAMLAMQADAARRTAAYNALPPDDQEGRATALRQLLGSVAEFALVPPPVFVDFGIHIQLGNVCFINTGAIFSTVQQLRSATALRWVQEYSFSPPVIRPNQKRGSLTRRARRYCRFA